MIAPANPAVDPTAKSMYPLSSSNPSGAAMTATAATCTRTSSRLDGRHELVGPRPEEQHLGDEGDDDALAQQPPGDALAQRLRVGPDPAERRLAGVGGVRFGEAGA